MFALNRLTLILVVFVNSFHLCITLGHRRPPKEDSVNIKITNKCSTDVLLECNGYTEVVLRPTQVFAFNYEPFDERITVCSAKSRHKSVEFDVFGGRAPKDSNEWEIHNNRIYLIKRVKYYSW